MSDGGPKSITLWFEQLRRGNPDAAAKLWDQFFDRIVSYAKRQMAGSNRRIADEEDIAANVMAALCRCAERGKLPAIENRDDLWRILLSWARHDIADHGRADRRLKRGSGQVRGDSIFKTEGGGFDRLAGVTMPADVIYEMTEQWLLLLAKLPSDSLRCVALRRLYGFTVSEIALELDVSPRTVERKLELIRSLWAFDGE